MKILKVFLGGLLAAVFLFCIYGALASLEPAENSPIHTGWFVGYIAIGLGSLTASILCVRSAIRVK